MPFGPPEFQRSPLRGIDFSWLAVDADDEVAWLVTFGSAVVPPWVERDADAFGDVDASIAALPERGGADARDASPAVRQWTEAARRGLFGYDWDVHSGPYELVARPARPVLASELPPPVAAVARRTRFAHLRFRDTATLGVADVLACVRPGA